MLRSIRDCEPLCSLVPAKAVQEHVAFVRGWFPETQQCISGPHGATRATVEGYRTTDLLKSA